MPAMTESTPGFENVPRFWDRSLNKTIAKILPGQYYVSHGQDLISTVLGSCVSACVRDKRTRVGAMNHFLLPEASAHEANSTINAPHRYGAFAMEAMLNDLFRAGVRRRDLEIKIVGGGEIMNSSARIGAKNVVFVTEYLEREGFQIVSADVGDRWARKVMYDVTTGRMLVKHMSPEDEGLQETESKYKAEINQPKAAAGDIELF